MCVCWELCFNKWEKTLEGMNTPQTPPVFCQSHCHQSHPGRDAHEASRPDNSWDDHCANLVGPWIHLHQLMVNLMVGYWIEGWSWWLFSIGALIQRMVNLRFGVWGFGFPGIPLRMEITLKGARRLNPKPAAPNHQFTFSWCATPWKKIVLETF